ncbi:MAG: DUF6470 family protein [Desulfitobacteriaceae bacterium]|nr:DUF6470 family protein [Desulfitobacteriaceae bacterium]MDI6879466.1 DUF6470 family protein [Desulfitobacteriaceae bacterium]MDI6912941.1 DUF6470 family protein [Desulfitobacteriaceae bacterium]
MVELQIQQQFGRTGIQQIPFQFKLDINPPDFEIRQKPATIVLEQPAAVIDIDFSPFRESLGYNGIDAQLRVFNEDAQATAQAGIERRVIEGNELGHIERKISLEQVVKEATDLRYKDLQLVSLASASIHIKQTPLRWNAEVGGVSVYATMGAVKSTFTYGQVRNVIEQPPYVQMHAVGAIYDTIS